MKIQLSVSQVLAVVSIYVSLALHPPACAEENYKRTTTYRNQLIVRWYGFIEYVARIPFTHA